MEAGLDDAVLADDGRRQVVEGGAGHHGPALDVMALLQAREDEAHHDASEHEHHHQDQAPEGGGEGVKLIRN